MATNNGPGRGRIVVRPPEVPDNSEQIAREAAWCWQLRLQGMSLRMISAASGNPPEPDDPRVTPGLGWTISHQTVANRLEMARIKVMAPGVEAFRELQAERYDALLRAYLPGLEARDPAMMAGYRQTLGDYSDLLGAKMPVRLQVEAAEPPEDPEAQAVLERIRAKRIGNEGLVIEHDDRPR